MGQPMKIVVTDCEYESLQVEREAMERIGASLLVCQCKSEAEIIEKTADADGIFVQFASISRRVIDNLKQCRVIVRYGIGIDCVDVKAATDHGIMVVNVPDYGLQDVADHTVTLLLTAARKIVLLNNNVKAGTWDYKRAKPVFRLNGMTLGLIAFGNIASMVAARVKPFGLHIQTYDPGGADEVLQKHAVARVDFDTLLATSDFISLHAPLLPSTRHMLNEAAFRKMKNSAILVNTARGGLVDEPALVVALQKGYLAGAALDVTACEPINVDNPLLTMDNVIITPHAAWYTEEAQQSLQLNATADMVRALCGDIPVNLLNPEVIHPAY